MQTGLRTTTAEPLVTRPSRPAGGRHRVVILGAGFAGMSAARRLEREPDIDITIVDRNNYMLFTPMLPEVSWGAIEPRHIAQPLRLALRRSQLVVGTIRDIDFAQRRVRLDDASGDRAIEVAFDTLVIALGTTTSTHGITGAAEHSFPLKTLEDATALRRRTIQMLDFAAASHDDAARKRALTFVIVGGGFTGVEAAGELRGYLTSLSGIYPDIDADELTVLLVAGSARLLEQLPERFDERARKMLQRKAVEVVLDDRVESVDPDRIVLTSGRRIDTSTVIWSAGVRPSPAIEHLDITQTKHHAIVVGADFAVPGKAGVWAVGDCAQIPNPRGGYYAQTAQDAVREGPLLAANINAARRGRPTREFRYRSPGMMASLGRGEGLADIAGLLVAGFPAWLLWRAYYLSQLPSMAHKVRVAVDWLLAAVFRADVASVR